MEILQKLSNFHECLSIFVYSFICFILKKIEIKILHTFATILNVHLLFVCNVMRFFYYY